MSFCVKCNSSIYKYSGDIYNKGAGALYQKNQGLKREVIWLSDKW